MLDLFCHKIVSKIANMPAFYVSYQSTGNDSKSRVSEYKSIYKELFPDGFNVSESDYSAYLLLHQLWNPNAKKTNLDRDYMQSLTAILLHNSLLSHQILKDKNSVQDAPKLEISVHPLAYLLMLCDELQCWNRFGYGRKSRTESHPISCDIDVIGEKITAK